MRSPPRRLTNKQAQGEQFTYAAITPTTRVGNYTQIFRKDFIVSNTQEAVSKAGPKSDFNREKLKKGMELKTDIEVTAVFNQASVAPSGATAGQMGGLRAWVATNDLMGLGRFGRLLGRSRHGCHQRHPARLHQGSDGCGHPGGLQRGRQSVHADGLALPQDRVLHLHVGRQRCGEPGQG
jgi:hypothetical protein